MIYLNYAALCPTLAEAEEEVERTLTEFKRYLYSEAGIEWYLRKVSDCRQQVGALLHVNDSSSIAFTTNASTAHYLLVSSLKWVPGDTILTTTHENPSITKQLRAREREGVHVRAVRPTSLETFLHALEERLDEPGVNAVVISHVSHVDGRIFPVQEVASLARARHCLVVIDGAQAVGHIPVDLNALDFDAYFFAGHKWCEGPLGTGALVARESFFIHIPVTVASKENPTTGRRRHDLKSARTTSGSLQDSPGPVNNAINGASTRNHNGPFEKRPRNCWVGTGIVVSWNGRDPMLPVS